MDAFIQAVDDARHRLNRLEGQTVSVRELIRRAGFPESKRAGVAYHLTPTNEWPRGHKVPPHVVEGLAKALAPVVSLEELQRAAQVAAGFNVAVDLVGVDLAVARFYEDETIDEESRAAMTARLMTILAEQVNRAVRS